MSKIFLPLTRLVIATVTGMGLASLLLPQASLADLGQPDNRPGFDSSNTNPCFGGADGSFNMFSLIHCANLNGSQFNSNQGNANLDAEAAAFRQRQQQLWQGQNSQTSPGADENQPLQIQLPIATPTGN